VEVSVELQKLRVAFLFSILFAGSTSSAANGVEALPLSVSVYNDASVPEKSLIAAETEAAQIYRASGVDVTWVNCPQPGIGVTTYPSCSALTRPGHLKLRIISHSLNLSTDIFGVAFLDSDGTGAYCDVFLDRIEALRDSHRTSEARILGIVMAHEMGHLLLGSNSHYRFGLMRARWLEDEFGKPLAGALAFTSDQSKRMRAKLLLPRSARESLSALAVEAN
jgi:hypothetical protein